MVIYLVKTPSRTALLEDPVANFGSSSSGDPWGVAQSTPGGDTDPYADLDFDGVRQQQQLTMRGDES